MTRGLVIVLALVASACADHHATPQPNEESVDAPVRADVALAELAWLDSLELPALDEDARVALAATPRECPPARPWSATPLPLGYDPDIYGFEYLGSIDGYDIIYAKPPTPAPTLPAWTDISGEGCMLEYTNARGEIEWRSHRLGAGERWLDRGADASIDLRRIDTGQHDMHAEQDFATCDALVYVLVRPAKFERERGFRAMLALPDAGELHVEPLQDAIFWQLGPRSGYERYENSANDNPLRVDGFDRAGVWQRSSLFSYDREYVVRHDFAVVEGEAKLVATLVLDRSSAKVELARTPARIEYRRHVVRSGEWQAELVASPEGVSRHGVFEGHERIARHGVVPVDIVRTAHDTRWQALGHGHFVERCDIEAPPRPDWMVNCLLGADMPR